MWMDHRATQEAELINQTNHSLLQFVGGAISVEMEMPKVLWLKKVKFKYAKYFNLILIVIVT